MLEPSASRQHSQQRPTGARQATGATVALSAILVVSFPALPATAQQVCVECAGPPATYKCTVKDADKLAASPKLARYAGQALGYVCVTELAKAGGHERCRVTTDYAGPCIGRERTVDLARPADESAVLPPEVAEEQPAPAPPVDAPPRTLEELARKSAEQSKEQLSQADQKLKEVAKSAGAEIEKAGTAVGDAVKKSVECVFTLFKSCLPGAAQ